MDIVKFVAAVITEDPNVILELDAVMNTPMNSSENVVDTTTSSANAEELLQKSVDEKDRITNKNRNNQQFDRQQKQRQAKLMSPRMKDLNRSLNKMQTGMTQNEKDTTEVRDQTTQLDRELDNVTRLLQQLETDIVR